MSDKLSHLNERGRSRMVDVSHKDRTNRTATASARVYLNEKTYKLVLDQGIKKGDVLAVAQIAGIMAGKNTANLIPMCHPIMISGLDIDFDLDHKDHSIKVIAKVSCTGETGVEMEALTAVSTAALTIYDMCKAVQKDIEIGQIRLETKTGGQSGDYQRQGGGI